MTVITYPFNIVDGDPESAGPVMANFQAVTAVVNGSLELGTNVSAAAPSAQNGSTINGGSSPSALRADAQFVIRGVETLTADPTSGNFDGRTYYNTSTHKHRAFINGSWQTYSNLAYSDLPAIPNNTLTSSMMGRSLVTASMGSDVSLADNAWTTVISSFSVTTTGANQLVTFLGGISCEETGNSQGGLCAWRVREGSTTVVAGGAVHVDVGSIETVRISRACTTLSAGAHTLSLQVSKGTSAAISARQNYVVAGETVVSGVQVVVG